MKSNVQEVKSMTSNIKINKSLTNKYKETKLFSEKLNWAKEHFKNRDMFKEIEEAEKITRS